MSDNNMQPTAAAEVEQQIPVATQQNERTLIHSDDFIITSADADSSEQEQALEFTKVWLAHRYEHGARLGYREFEAIIAFLNDEDFRPAGVAQVIAL